MSSHPKQVVIQEALWSFMQYCEVYCSGACCGIGAFEVHRAMLLRKVADMHLAGVDGSTAFREAWRQLAELRKSLASEPIESEHGDVPFWSHDGEDLPEFWLPSSEVSKWLEQWDTAFTEASRFAGLAKGSAEPGAARNSHRPLRLTDS